jgi:hypothetical protein
MSVKELQEVYLEELIHRIRFSWKKPSDQLFDSIRIYYAIYDSQDFFHFIDIDPQYNTIDLSIMGLIDPEPFDNIPIYNDIIEDGIRYNFKVVGVYNNIESNGLVLNGSALSGFKLYSINNSTQTRNIYEFNDIDQIPSISGNNFTISGLDIGKLYNIIPASYIITKDGSIIESEIDYSKSSQLLSYPKPVISQVRSQNGYINIYFPEVVADGDEKYLFYVKEKNTNNNYQLVESTTIIYNNNPVEFKSTIFLNKNIFLQPNIEYDFILKASSIYGISEPSEPSIGIIYPGIPSLPIKSLSINNITFNSATIEWIDNDLQLEDIDGYILSYNNIDISFNTNIKSFALQNLNGKTIYNISIRTFNFYGESIPISQQITTKMDPIIYTYIPAIQKITINFSRKLRLDEQLYINYFANDKIKNSTYNTDISYIILSGLYGGIDYNINVTLTDINTNETINNMSIIKTGEKKPNIPIIELSRYNKRSIEVKWYIPGTII